MQDNFNGGYTKALLDVQAYIKNHSDVLKFCKLYNRKGIEKLIDALVDNRAELRNTGTVNLRYDRTLGEFLHD